MILLSETFTISDDDEENIAEYYKMMSRYLIQVHLFNVFCGVRMESGWNESVKNLYVYNFEKLPAGQFEKNINSPNNSQEASETKEAQPHKVLMSNVLYQADRGVIKDFISAWLSSREGEVKKGCTI